MSARDFLVRGLLAGLIAAFAAFGVAYVVGEPPVRAAIARLVRLSRTRRPSR